MKLYIALALLAITACNNGADKDEKIDTSRIPTEPASPTPVVNGCYMEVVERDTITAQLTQDGNNIQGTLTFDNYEKDGSTGTVKGTIDGDVLKLMYSYQSEGIKSVMQVYMKRVEDRLVRGIGDMETRGDTTYYIDSVMYTGSTSMQKIECSTLNR